MQEKYWLNAGTPNWDFTAMQMQNVVQVGTSAQLTSDPDTAMSNSVMIPTQVTALSWPYSVWTGRGVMWMVELLPVPRWLTSHTIHVVSLEPVIRNDPHWSKATHVTRSVNIHVNIWHIIHGSTILIRSKRTVFEFCIHSKSLINAGLQRKWGCHFEEH